RLIRTNVRRRLLPADVLLPRGERENESALASTICGLANQPTWHLADKLLAGGDYTTVRSSEPKRNSEGLRFHRNYVRLARRFYDAKRNRFGDRDHQQSAALVRDRKSTRLNSSHVSISYAVFCLKKKKMMQL